MCVRAVRNRPTGTGQCGRGEEGRYEAGCDRWNPQGARIHRGPGQAPPSIVNFEHTSETMFIPYRGEKFEYIGGKSYRFMARLA